jgi:transcription elongation factor SPT4
LDQFDEEGCDNCDDFLRLKNNRDRVFDCTSANFDGMMAIMDPTESWVARWQRIDNCVRGMYAISVSGELPENIKRLLREKDIPYRSRDVSHKA